MTAALFVCRSRPPKQLGISAYREAPCQPVHSQQIIAAALDGVNLAEQVIRSRAGEAGAARSKRVPV
jgi:hypothetical protein